MRGAMAIMTSVSSLLKADGGIRGPSFWAMGSEPSAEYPPPDPRPHAYEPLMVNKHLRDLISDSVNRIERGHGALERSSKSVSPDLLHLALWDLNRSDS
jgi:hypothetical protein